MTNDEWDNMGGCVIDGNEEENLYGVQNEEGNKRKLISIVVDREDDPFGIRNRQRKSQVGITIDLNNNDVRKRRSQSEHKITIDLTIDDDPFGIRKGGTKGCSVIDITHNRDDDPFGIRKGGTKHGNIISINLDGYDDPFSLRNKANNLDDDPFGIRIRAREIAGKEKMREYEEDGFDDADTPVYDMDECDDGQNIGVGMIIDSLQECELLYNRHAKLTGFSIRRVEKRKNVKGIVIRRKWVCSKEGHRQPTDLDPSNRSCEPRAITRVGCLASFTVKLDKSVQKYVVQEFNEHHNHSLTHFDDSQFLRSHRSVGLPDQSLIKGLLSVGIKPAQIMDYFVQQAGGYKYVGFTSKDLSNYINLIRREVLIVGDAQSVITYLRAKKDSDPNFYLSHDSDDQNRMTNLFWADGRSRADYACFGDAVAFDSTYKTNAYRKPLVILVGVNHHHQTTIFGCALLVDETEKTYCWVLNTFLAAMANKVPISVLTDGDKAMRNAIQICFPGTRHRLCSWHLHNNSTTNVHEKGFSSEFQKCMATWYTKEDFEAAWKDIIVRYKLQNNEWVADTYANRELWAEAYLRGTFFAGMRSTQRCEGMNAYLNRFLETRLKLFEVVRQVERANTRLRQKNAKAEFDSSNGLPVMTTVLRSLEEHGAEIYTKKSFIRFRSELKHEALYSVLDKAENGSDVTYTLRKYCDDGSINQVTYHKGTSTLQCSCQRFESNGIPCRHMLAVVKFENLTEIPECCITKRWCKIATCQMEERINQSVPDDVATSMRYGALSAVCNNLSYLASQSRNVFEVVRTEIDVLTSRITDLNNSFSNPVNNGNCSGTPANREVEDPVIVKTKGRPGGNGKISVKRPRKCSRCHNIGHNRARCVRSVKAPKIKKSKKACKQNIKVDPELDTNEDELEDQWEYSAMPSPKHNSTENFVGVNSDEVGHGSEGHIYHGTSSYTYRGNDRGEN